MATQVEIINSAPHWLDYVTAFGTAGAAIAAAGAAWVAVRQSKQATGRHLHFAISGPDVTAPGYAAFTLIVTNDSFRSITIKDVGFKYAGNPRHDVITFTGEADAGPTPPLTLAAGEAAEWVFNANKLFQALGGGKRPLMQMVALDSRGVEYTQWWSREPIKRIPLRLAEWRRKRRQARHFRRVWKQAQVQQPPEEPS